MSDPNSIMMRKLVSHFTQHLSKPFTFTVPHNKSTANGYRIMYTILNESHFYEFCRVIDDLTIALLRETVSPIMRHLANLLNLQSLTII